MLEVRGLSWRGVAHGCPAAGRRAVGFPPVAKLSLLIEKVAGVACRIGLAGLAVGGPENSGVA